MWVADSGAPYHMPDDPIFMFECMSLSVSKGALLVGDMKSIEVEWFGKLNMVTHSAGRDLFRRGLDERFSCPWSQVPFVFTARDYAQV